MMARKILPIFVLCVLCVTPRTASAQEPSKFSRFISKAWELVTAPNKSLDTTYVIHPRLNWMVGVDGNIIHTGVNLNSDITVSDFSGETASIYNGTLNLGMTNSLYKKVGITAAYGMLSLGYGVEIGKKKGEHNTYFSFGTNGASYGFQIQYYKTHQYASGTLSMDDAEPVTVSSNLPGELRDFSVNGFYAFNRHRFIFSSAYSARTIQRRSAGSWLVTAKYMYGSFALDPEDDVMLNMLNGLHQYSTHQVSLGGGYSFNWVIFHREPENYANWKGLRNLTLNATLLPQISVWNNIKTEQMTENAVEKVRYDGQPTFTPAIRSALCYCWSRYHLNIQATFNRFSFHGAGTDVDLDEEDLRIKVDTRGVFYDLSASMQFGVRF